MSKERLEEIRNRMIVEKQHFKYLNNEKGYWENVYTLLEHDMEFLFDTIIEQAERVRDLEGNAENIYRANHDFSRRIDKIRRQNKRYREYLRRLQRATKRYPAEDTAYVVNKITSEALEGEE